MKHLVAVNPDVITTGNPGLIQLGMARQHSPSAQSSIPLSCCWAFLAATAKHAFP